MQHAISPAAGALAAHYHQIDKSERYRIEIDRRSDAIRDEIDNGDWKFVEDCLADAPVAQKKEFYDRSTLTGGYESTRGRPQRGRAERGADRTERTTRDAMRSNTSIEISLDALGDRGIREINRPEGIAMPQDISLTVGESSLYTNRPFLALQLLQHLCPEIAPSQPIYGSETLDIGDRIDCGRVFARHWVGGIEYALVDMGVEVEVRGAWGKRDQEVATTHGDGLANTQAMADAGSELAKLAIEAGAYIPSAAESHLLMCAKESGLITDLRDGVRFWTSTQFSAYNAYSMDFEAGWQLSNVKNCERPVRLVRRIPVIR